MSHLTSPSQIIWGLTGLVICRAIYLIYIHRHPEKHHGTSWVPISRRYLWFGIVKIALFLMIIALFSLNAGGLG